MNKKAKYIQLATEALIPLLGFFLWDWSLYFIILFYFIDMTTDEVITHAKANKIVKYSGRNEKERSWLWFGVLSTTTLILAVGVIHLALYFISDGIVFKQEAIAFWEYEELGLKQGYLLVPLVFFVGYQQYKMEFLMLAKYRNLSLSDLWRRHIQALCVVVAFAGFCIGLAQFIVLPDIVYVLGIVFCTVFYKLTKRH
jgi:hypothetical protein